MVSFSAWKAGQVAPSQHEITIVAPKPGLKLEPVSSRLKQELIHPNRRSALWGLQFSPNGKRIVSGDYPGGVVVVWDIATGKQLMIMETGYGLRNDLELMHASPDGQTGYVCPPGKRRLDRVEKDGKKVNRWTFDGSVCAWDLETGRLLQTYKHQPRRNIRGMALSPDGTKFITWEELPGTYERSPKWATSLWDVRTGKCLTLPDGLESIGKFSPDGQSLAITAVDADGHSRALKVLDTATGQEKLSMPVRDKNVWLSVAAFSPDGRLMVGNYRVFERAKKWDDYQCWLKWWDTATGREVASFAGEKKEIFSTSRFSPDGRTLAVVNSQGEKDKLVVFHVPDRRLTTTIILGQKAKGESLSVALPVFSPDSKWLAIRTQAIPETRNPNDLQAQDVPQPRIHLIDAAAGEIRETLVAPQAFGLSVCFSPDGKTLATEGHGRVLLWDLTKPPGTAASAPAR